MEGESGVGLGHGYCLQPGNGKGFALMLSCSIGQDLPSSVSPPTQTKMENKMKMRNTTRSGRKTMMMMMTTLMKTTFCSMMSQITLTVTPTLTMMMPMTRGGLSPSLPAWISASRLS